MKRRIISIFCAVLIAISMVGSITAYAIGESHYYVTVTTCNVRSTESTSGSILATLPKGTTIRDYYDRYTPSNWEYDNESWSPVLQGNSLGYIRSDYVCPLSSAYYVNTTSGINLRVSPTVYSSSIGTLQYNTIVCSLGHSSYADGHVWFEVIVMTGTYKGNTGWVAYTYLSTYAH